VLLRDTGVSNVGHCGDSALRAMRPRKRVLLRDTGVSKSEAALETWNISKFEAAADLSLVVAGTTKRLCHDPSKINTMHNECTHEHMRARQNRAQTIGGRIAGQGGRARWREWEHGHARSQLLKITQQARRPSFE